MGVEGFDIEGMLRRVVEELEGLNKKVVEILKVLKGGGPPSPGGPKK